MIWGIRWLALAVLWIFSAPSVATAQTAAEFFKGREMHLLVGAAAGGGYDLYARFFARHLPNFSAGRQPGHR
jgi:tripartite-type tricarboxylate transporter receptor subunit TctC